MLPAISKQRKLQPSSHCSCPQWRAWGHSGRSLAGCLCDCSHPQLCTLRASGRERRGFWPHIVEGRSKEWFQRVQTLASFHTQFSSVQFSLSIMSNSLQPHELQHARPPRPSPTPRVYPNLCPLSWWCHPTISSSVFPFFSCPQSFPASGSFQMSQFFASGGQSIGI